MRQRCPYWSWTRGWRHRHRDVVRGTVPLGLPRYAVGIASFRPRISHPSVLYLSYDSDRDSFLQLPDLWVYDSCNCHQVVVCEQKTFVVIGVDSHGEETRPLFFPPSSFFVFSSSTSPFPTNLSNQALGHHLAANVGLTFQGQAMYWQKCAQPVCASSSVNHLVCKKDDRGKKKFRSANFLTLMIVERSWP